MAPATKPVHPLFNDYTIDELHKRTGYSEVYLIEVKNGRILRPRFIKTVCGILNRSEAELFGGDSDG